MTICGCVRVVDERVGVPNGPRAKTGWDWGVVGFHEDASLVFDCADALLHCAI